ncbi:MAG TPA: phospholipase D-like domain-containing protein [Candidatus Heimdallarchaeota archaeon]|nr:phospholipase D-like domain-containing protein [Candidatus Heimdallarchaeota archaeon]
MRKLILTVAIVVMVAGSAVAQTCTIRTNFGSPPDSGAIKVAIIQAIDGARTTLDIALHSFTDDQLGDTVARAARRGVSVRVILSAGQDDVLGGEYDKLVAANIEVVVVGAQALFNHRFAVVDERIVITGSYDWSDYSNKSRYDDVLFISCTAGSSTVREFTVEFERLWQKLSVETGTIVTQPSLSSGVQSVVIHSVDPAGECIQLLDVSSAPIDISGWRLSDLEGSYTFPSDTIINPDDPYEVCIDTYNPTLDTEGLYLNDDHDEVFLITPDGRIIDERVWGD